MKIPLKWTSHIILIQISELDRGPMFSNSVEVAVFSVSLMQDRKRSRIYF